jgi:hypothetical protein
MSAFGDLQTMCDMVGFRYATLSVDSMNGMVTLQCEDHDGQTITVEAVDTDAALMAMIQRLGSMIDRGDE